MNDDALIPPPAPSGNSLAAAAAKGENAVRALFGGADLIPSSLMVMRRLPPDADRDAMAAARDYRYSLPESFKAAQTDATVPKAVRSMMRGSGSGANAGTLSKFPQDVGRAVILWYSEPGDTVVDPFAGHNSRMELCVRAGRNYVGCDLSTEFMRHNRARAAVLRREFPGARIDLHHTDSRTQPIPDGTGDVTITSPPYWDIEYYGDEPEQLGKCRTYRDFMDGMQQCLAENYRTLKPGAYSAWFINDFRKDGVMYFYHADLLRRGERVGFEAVDLMVVDLGRGLTDCFVNRMMVRKYIPKRHEYAVIFRKPTRG